MRIQASTGRLGMPNIQPEQNWATEGYLHDFPAKMGLEGPALKAVEASGRGRTATGAGVQALSSCLAWEQERQYSSSVRAQI